MQEEKKYFGFSETAILGEMVDHDQTLKGQVVSLDGSSLTVEDVVGVARNGCRVELSASAREAVEKAYMCTQEMVKNGEHVYGVTTGFGSLSETVISAEESAALSGNILKSHAIGVGKPMPASWVRAGILIRVNALVKGHSGVSMDTINALLGLLNEDVVPVIPRKGSLACSGDLCLLSHMALVINDDASADNPVLYKGRIRMGKECLIEAGVKCSKFGYKEGLAVVNGSTFTAGIACLAFQDAQKLYKLSLGSLALSMEALCGVKDAYERLIHDLRGHKGQKEVARSIRLMIEGSKLVGSKKGVQDAYSLRCAPQVQGVLFDELNHMEEMLTNEINAVTDNPILDVNKKKFISGGNFNGQVIGHFADNLKTALAEVGAISERRQFRLLDPSLNKGLNAMLTKNPGLNSGYMITQYTSASLCLANQSLANPSTTLSLPTCANQEDHNSNAYNAVCQLAELTENVFQVISFEYLLALRGIQFRIQDNKNLLGLWSKPAYEYLENCLDKNVEDHVISGEHEALKNSLKSSELINLVDKTLTTQEKGERLGIPRGTRDFGPKEMKIRKEVMDKIEKIFVKHGGVTIDTPVFELKDTLFGKYGDNDKLVFDLNDQGGSLCSLRYDLTVPFARYMAMSSKTKMRRYHMAKVYRRDNPAIARGRYREFFQCDFDIAGNYDPMVPDAEVIKIMCEILDSFNIKYTVKLNHKGLLDSLLAICQVPKDKIMTTCSSIDKLDKLPWNDVAQELKGKGLTPTVISNIQEMCKFNGQPLEILNKIRQAYCGNNEIQVPLDDLELLFSYLEPLDCLKNITFDTSLCRGLTYYTGVIFEAVLTENTLGVGSIAAGGRYDNLVGMFTGGTQIPSVGCSIGIERIFSALEAQSDEIAGDKSDTKCYITYINDRKSPENNKLYFGQVLKVANKLWSENIPTEIVNTRKEILKEQIGSIAKVGIPVLVFVAGNEYNQGLINIKNLITEKQVTVPICDVVQHVKDILATL